MSQENPRQENPARKPRPSATIAVIRRRGGRRCWHNDGRMASVRSNEWHMYYALSSTDEPPALHSESIYFAFRKCDDDSAKSFAGMSGPALHIIPHSTYIFHLPSLQRRPTRIRTNRTARGTQPCSSIPDPLDGLRYASSLEGGPWTAGRPKRTHVHNPVVRYLSTEDLPGSPAPNRRAANLCPLPEINAHATDGARAGHHHTSQ